MTGLSNADREALMNGVVIAGREFIHNPNCGQVYGNKFLRKPREGDRLAGCCHRMSAVIASESVNEAVAAALLDAADEIHRRLWAQGTRETKRKAYPTGVAWRGAANTAVGILRDRAAAITSQRQPADRTPGQPPP